MPYRRSQLIQSIRCQRRPIGAARARLVTIAAIGAALLASAVLPGVATAGGLSSRTFKGKPLGGERYVFKLRGIAARKVVRGSVRIAGRASRRVTARALRRALRHRGILRIVLRRASTSPRPVLRVFLDSKPPTRPRSLAAVPGDGTERLSWAKSRDNVAVAGYRVLVDGVRVAKLRRSARAYTVRGLVNGRSYRFSVRAVDAAANLSAKATIVSAPSAPSASSAPTGASGTPAPPSLGAEGTEGTKLPRRLPQSTGQAFYVSPTGSDTNAGTQAAPWRTVQKALDSLAAGQTAILRGGTYAQNVTATRGGTASAPITIRNQPGETAILRPGGGAGDSIPLELASGAAYLRFSGVVIEGATGPSTTNVYAFGNAHDIELSDCENRNSARQGFYSEKSTSRIQIIGCHFHDNGGSGPLQLDHQIYIQGGDHLVLGNLLNRAPNGYGIQVYPQSSNIIVAQNTINSTFRDGIIVGSDGSTTTTGATIVNNIITNARSAIVTYWGGTVGSNNVARNNIAYNTSSTAFSGNGMTYTNNKVADPRFAGSNDFHLQSTSPALSIADPDYSSARDLDQEARPQGAGPDLGAFEG